MNACQKFYGVTTEIFILPVTSYHVSISKHGNGWPKYLTLEFGTLTQETHPAINGLPEVSHLLGEHQIFIKSDWEIWENGSRLSYRDSPDLIVMNDAPAILLQKHLRGISVSDDYNRVTFTFTGGCRVIAQNSLPDREDYVYLSIR